MSQQGERPTGRQDDWWGQLYDEAEGDTGPAPAADSLDDRFASATDTLGASAADGSAATDPASATVPAGRDGAQRVEPPRPASAARPDGTPTEGGPVGDGGSVPLQGGGERRAGPPRPVSGTRLGGAHAAGASSEADPPPWWPPSGPRPAPVAATGRPRTVDPRGPVPAEPEQDAAGSGRSERDPAPDPVRRSGSRHRPAPWEAPTAGPPRPAASGPAPTAPGPGTAPPPTAMSPHVPGPAAPGSRPQAPGAPAAGLPADGTTGSAGSSGAAGPAHEEPPSAAAAPSGAAADRPYQPGRPPPTAGTPSAGIADAPARREPGTRRGAGADSRDPERAGTPAGTPPPGRPGAPGQYFPPSRRAVAPTPPSPGERSPAVVEVPEDLPADQPVLQVPDTPAPLGHVGSGPPTYAPEPTALPPADPDDLDDLVADTVLDGASYGTGVLRAVSVRGDSARYRGEPRRDSLLTARFGVGDGALVLVAMATGARAAPGAHRAAAEACRWIGRAVGRSHARLAEDIRAARRGDLKSGLHRLTDRSLGKLRAGAAEQGVEPEEYTASLRCLLLPADPECRTRVFFGVGAGGLFRLRDGEWQDIEPRVADTAGEPVMGFGSLPHERPEGDRLTVDLGITTPPSPYEPAPEPPARDPFRFRASVARPGDVLLLCSSGLAEPLRGEPRLAEYLTSRWSGGRPPGLAAFLADSTVRVKGYADDRTAAAVWEA